MKREVVAIARDDIHWPFAQEPYVNVGQGRWGGQIHRVDPFPAYAHDKGLTEDTLGRVTEAFPHGGDLAIFLVSGATEVMYEGEKYFIVPQSAILMLEREEDF